MIQKLKCDYHVKCAGCQGRSVFKTERTLGTFGLKYDMPRECRRAVENVCGKSHDLSASKIQFVMLLSQLSSPCWEECAWLKVQITVPNVLE